MSGELKRLKDPLYGYITIPEEYVNNIIDTAPFQRLRRVTQTSYAPLYPSSVHNRFVHSLGVYHLGCLASERIKAEITKLEIKTRFCIEKYCKLFVLACLLHDAGHSPFSHVGEKFFIDDEPGREYERLHKLLINEAGSRKSFVKDIPKDSSRSAAPHEIMSAIIGIKEYGVMLDKLDESEGREFFARCITGYTYSNRDTDSDIKNCFISLLNSKVIDVDKLDYLLRDAYITGFDTISIDYNRLIGSITIAAEKEHYRIAYYKSAVSVIENVVYAHDAERKWIQNHPVVLYEAYILRRVIDALSGHLDSDDKKLFSSEALSRKGQRFNHGIKISLLCDDDIIFLMKNGDFRELGALSEEFFDRKTRRHPIWKSESEYKAYILDLDSDISLVEDFEAIMTETAKYLSKATTDGVIDDALIAKFESELKEIESIDIPDIDEESKEIQIKNKKLILEVMKSLKAYSSDNGIECSFVILEARQFTSGFGKPDFANINIVFRTSAEDKLATVDKIVSSIQAKAKENDRDTFFYIFYKRKNGSEKLDSKDFCEKLYMKIKNLHKDRI